MIVPCIDYYCLFLLFQGATDGIGKAYALALAKQGLSIMLISRTETKLQDVQKEIESKGYDGVEVKYVVCDYSNFDQKAQNTVNAAITDLDIGVLINNVGVSYRYVQMMFVWGFILL